MDVQKPKNLLRREYVWTRFLLVTNFRMMVFHSTESVELASKDEWQLFSLDSYHVVFHFVCCVCSNCPDALSSAWWIMMIIIMAAIVCLCGSGSSCHRPVNALCKLEVIEVQGWASLPYTAFCCTLYQWQKVTVVCFCFCSAFPGFCPRV